MGLSDNSFLARQSSGDLLAFLSRVIKHLMKPWLEALGLWPILGAISSNVVPDPVLVAILAFVHHESLPLLTSLKIIKAVGQLAAPSDQVTTRQ